MRVNKSPRDMPTTNQDFETLNAQLMPPTTRKVYSRRLPGFGVATIVNCVTGFLLTAHVMLFVKLLRSGGAGERYHTMIR